MAAGIFARQLTEAPGHLTAGISVGPEDIDGIARARVLSLINRRRRTPELTEKRHRTRSA
jgi:hypothetical protein